MDKSSLYNGNSADDDDEQDRSENGLEDRLRYDSRYELERQKSLENSKG
jgi:hypothetical protein